MSQPRIALLFAQFAAYHVDRCEAVAQRLAGRAEVLAVEVATTSSLYAWAPSGTLNAARKLTLFPGRSYDDIARWRRFWRQFRCLWRCDMVYIGIGYNEPDIIALSWVLRLCGVRVVLLSESKFDDVPRRAGFELLKAAVLLAYHAAVVGAARHMAYMRFLGFRRRAVLPGYGAMGLARVLAQGGGRPSPEGRPHAERHFLFVGRFVEKKNLFALLDGYAAYHAAAGAAAHRLVLAGGGPQEVALRGRITALGLEDAIELPGFLSPEAVAHRLADSLALVLVSRVEQWGQVVNEALAFHLPVILSRAVGSRDALLRNLINGFVVEEDSPDGLAAAMAELASEATWRRMVAAAADRAWLADTERLADTVEYLFAPTPEGAARIAKFKAAIGWDDARFEKGWKKRQI